jgi:hypothetical protein
MRVQSRAYPGFAWSRFACWPVVLGCALAGMDGHAQEALRTAVEADRAYEIRQLTGGWADAPLRAGPMQLAVGTGLEAEWNDNVTISDADPLEDYILRPQLNLQAFWPMTEQLRLSFGVGVGYTIYLQGHREDRLLLSPDSQLAFDMRFRDVLVTVYNQVRYQDDPISEPGLSEGREFAQLSNTAGARATWLLNDWRLQAGYSHFNFWSLTDSFRYLDRASDQVYVRVGLALAPSTQIGMESSGSVTRYDQSIRSDFLSASVGPFLEWRVTEHLELRLRGGYVHYDFEERAGAAPLEPLDTYYLGLAADHQLTRFLSHGVAATREVRVAIEAEYAEQFRAEYGVRWNLLEPVTVSTQVFYDHSREPRPVQDERFHRVGGGLEVGYEVTDRIRAEVRYRFITRDSNLPGRNYAQNSVLLGLRYRL